MGAGESASADDVALAERLGELLARDGWIVLTGGRRVGVMAAAVRGAKRAAGSITVGVLPSESGEVADDVDVAIFTGMGNARNAINVLSSTVVFACGVGGPGTASEVALAIKSGRPVVLVTADRRAREFFAALGGSVRFAETAEEAVSVVRGLQFKTAD